VRDRDDWDGTVSYPGWNPKHGLARDESRLSVDLHRAEFREERERLRSIVAAPLGRCGIPMPWAVR
jgi:hypothetical protein